MNTQVKVTEKEQAWGKCEMGAGAYTYVHTHMNWKKYYIELQYFCFIPT